MKDSSKSSTTRGGISFLSLLCLLFIGLKLTGHITWSWWLVLAPVWIPWSIFLGIIFFMFLATVVLSRWM